MSTIELLNYQQHKNVRVVSESYSATNANVSSAMIVPSEFLAAQREFPIFFKKDPNTGQFYPCVILGFEKNENLFIQNDKWQSSYIPLTLHKGPFLIGYQDQKNGDDIVKVPVVYIDTGDLRVSEEKGELLFDNNGDRSSYLNRISNILMDIHHGVESAKQMVSLLSDENLIEPVSLGVELVNGEKIDVRGVYSINSETLNTLSGSSLERLNRKGVLRLAFSVVNSIENFKHLIDKKNKSSEKLCV